MQEISRGNEYRTTLVCVDSYENGVPAGRFYNPGCSEGKTFLSLTQFLVKMENLLDSMQFPQSFTAVRTFGASMSSTSVSLDDDRMREGDLATFTIRILFRQNASWQGSVAWLEGKMEESFRSVLELILLMDSAMRETE